MTRRHVARALPLVVALVAFVAFIPALGAGFVSWDDERNFLTNPHYRGLGLTQLRWMWSTTLLGHYVPLSWMTLGLDYELWGMNPRGYHLTNVLLHVANAILLFFLARRIFSLIGVTDSRTDPPLDAAVAAAFAALLFAVHPLRVESVAWVTERRDVLSALCYLATVLCYLRGADGGDRGVRWYWASVALFVAALLSKGTAVTAPAVLLILNVYPLRRLGGASGWWSRSARRVYLEMIPYATLAAATVVLSIVALRPPAQLPIAGKIAVSAYSLSFYLWKTIAPVDLSPLYGMPTTVNPGAPPFLASYGVVGALAIVAWVGRRRWPGMTAAVLAFVAISLPMLGIVQNGPQIAADRYTYHAAPALAILAGGGLCLLARSMSAAVVGAGAAAILIVLATLTAAQTSVWRDSTRLWARVLEVEPDSPMGHSATANLLFKKNDVTAAMAHSARAVALAPTFPEAHNDLGVGLARQGRLNEALDAYRRALALKPRYDEAENNIGVVMVQLGALDSAVARYQRALEINPNNPDAQVNWGNALVRIGRTDEAIEHYRTALWIRPDHADAEHNWGVALARAGRFAEAVRHFELALAIDPAHPEAREYLRQATQLLRDQRP